jgi:iron(III) transport system permease protein
MASLSRQLIRSRFVLALATLALGAVAALSPPGTRRVLANSALLALGSAAIALPAGTLLAVLLARFELPGRRLAVVCIGLLLFLPLVVQISGWDAAIGKLGWYTLAWSASDRSVLAGLPAAILLHGLTAIGWMALIVGLGLSRIDARQEEAGLLETSPMGVLFGITLPQARSFLLAAGLWVAVATASDMTVTNIYLIDPAEMTYTEQFYMNYSTALDAKAAALGGLAGFVALGVLLLAALWMLAIVTSERVMGGRIERLALSTGWSTLPLTILLWGVLLVLLAVPLASLITKAGFVVVQTGDQRVRSWSAAKAWEVVRAAPAAYREELQWTLVIALLAATLATCVAIVLAAPARRGGWRSLPAIAAVVLTMATPGPLVGVLLMRLLNQPWSPPLIYLYDKTVLAPVLAQAIRALPVAILIVWHALATLGDDELSAAALDGAGTLRRLWLIVLPQRWPAMIGAWLAALAVAAGDLAWSNLVMPPGVETVQRRLFGLIHYGADEQVAGICLVVAAVYAVLVGAIAGLLRFQAGPRRQGGTVRL